MSGAVIICLENLCLDGRAANEVLTPSVHWQGSRDGAIAYTHVSLTLQAIADQTAGAIVKRACWRDTETRSPALHLK